VAVLAGGRIELTAGAIGERVAILVQDNGIGIGPAARAGA